MLSRRIALEGETRKLSKAAGAPAAAPADSYLELIVKCIPVEIVAVFLFIDGLLKAGTPDSSVFYWVVFFVLLICTPLYMLRVTAEPDMPPVINQVIVATGAFVVWVFAIGGPFAAVTWYQPVYGSVVLALYTVIIPIILGKKR